MRSQKHVIAFWTADIGICVLHLSCTFCKRKGFEKAELFNLLFQTCSSARYDRCDFGKVHFQTCFGLAGVQAQKKAITSTDPRDDAFDVRAELRPTGIKNPHDLVEFPVRLVSYETWFP